MELHTLNTLPVRRYSLMLINMVSVSNANTLMLINMVSVSNASTLKTHYVTHN